MNALRLALVGSLLVALGSGCAAETSDVALDDETVGESAEAFSTATRFTARGTGYYPDASPLEGGFVDRRGKPLRTLQQYLAGNADYVSVAMDSKAFPYGTKLRIHELERKYGRTIEFRVVDTGGAFKGKWTSRIDICTANERASLDSTINGTLTIDRVR
jgi:3D (Asp-Asp-Asp) domain-containing protein